MVILALVSAGCHDRLCYDVGIDPNGRYRATVVAVYDAQGTFTYDRSLIVSAGVSSGSCAQLDGIGAATSVEFLAKGAVDNSNDNCKLIPADLISAPSQIAPGARRRTPTSSRRACR